MQEEFSKNKNRMVIFGYLVYLLKFKHIKIINGKKYMLFIIFYFIQLNSLLL